MAVDITHPAFKADPFPFYARLRSEDPVHRIVLPNKQQAWLITRYDDVVAALTHERLVEDPLRVAGATCVTLPWMPKMFLPLTRNMLDLDPPDHTRLRTLVHRAFTPRIVERMRDRIADLSERNCFSAKRRADIDLISDYVLPFRPRSSRKSSPSRRRIGIDFTNGQQRSWPQTRRRGARSRRCPASLRSFATSGGRSRRGGPHRRTTSSVRVPRRALTWRRGLVLRRLTALPVAVT